MIPEDALLLTKLALVAASILGASLIARRYGHAVSGALAGLPVIVGPIIAILLIDLPAERVRGIALATLVCEPAMLAHIVVFAHAARRFGWPACLALATTTYVALAAALPQFAAGPLMASLVAGAALLLSTHLLPATGAGPDGPIDVPNSELWWRLAAALAIAALVMWGADHFPAAIAGALLAVPITGSVLPCFTLPRHGPQATARLLAGFVRGQSGFFAFFVVLLALLPHAPKAAAFLLAMGAALAAPWLSNKIGAAMRAQRAAA
ncbi:MAG: hypothetical protein ABI433_06320 [Burkholderiaceae bacterium]